MNQKMWSSEHIKEFVNVMSERRSTSEVYCECDKNITNFRVSEEKKKRNSKYVKRSYMSLLTWWRSGCDWGSLRWVDDSWGLLWLKIVAVRRNKICILYQKVWSKDSPDPLNFHNKKWCDLKDAQTVWVNSTENNVVFRFFNHEKIKIKVCQKINHVWKLNCATKKPQKNYD